MDLNRKTTRTLLGMIAFAIVLFMALWRIEVVMRGIVTLIGMASFFFIGLSVAFVLNRPMRIIELRLFAPLNRRLGKTWHRMRRPLAVLLTLLLLIAVLLTVVFMVIPEIVHSAGMLAAEVPGALERLSAWLNTLDNPLAQEPLQYLEQINWEQIGQELFELLRNGAGQFLTGTLNVASSIVTSVISFVIGLILAVYVLLGKDKLGGQVKRLMTAYLPAGWVERILYVAAKANQIFGNFLSGQFLEALILGMMCFIGMLVFGFQFAPMVSVLVGVTAFIPIFGAFIGGTVGVFVIFVQQGWMMALWFIVFIVALQQIEGNLIYPHVVGKSVMLPGIWVLTAVTLGGNLAGIAGMFISVPLCSLLYALLREAVNRRNANREALPLPDKAKR